MSPLRHYINIIENNASFERSRGLTEFINPIPCFYHGSDVPNIKTMKPQQSTLADARVVFAAILPEIAVAMSGHWTDDFDFGHDVRGDRPDIVFKPYVMTERRPGAFEKFFGRPVYLYQLPARYFEPQDYLQDFEVVSYKSVPVHTIIKVDDPLAYLAASPNLRLVRVSGKLLRPR